MMRRAVKWASRLFVFVGVIVLALVVFGPYEPVDVETSFEPRRFGEGIGVYLESTESAFDDIRPGSEKRIVWEGQRETRTPVSVVYFHGFSASSEEIRPVPDRVAKALGANLVYTRFTGHGRDGDAMAEASVHDWMQDAAEAMALGRAVGDRVILLTTSTGGTIAAAALHQPEMRKGVAGVVFISPNFGINNPAAPLLTLPAARYWLPMIVGERREFEPQNAGQSAHWTWEYPTVAVFPMAAIVNYASGLDYSAIDVPALFYYSNKDNVVRPDLTALVEAEWGGPVTHISLGLGDDVDENAHVIAGDIMSPGNTDEAVTGIVEWAKGLQ